MGAGTLAALAAAPGPALAAPSPPSLASAFTPPAITVGGTTALSFTITNPNLSGSLSGIGFTDTLPAGVVVDNPNGLNGTCGSTSTLTANPGSNTITLAGGKLAAGANCLVSAAVTSNTPWFSAERHRTRQLDRGRRRCRRHSDPGHHRVANRERQIANRGLHLQLRPEGDRALQLQGGNGRSGRCPTAPATRRTAHRSTLRTSERRRSRSARSAPTAASQPRPSTTR